jgi:hypothetical protein
MRFQVVLVEEEVVMVVQEFLELQELQVKATMVELELQLLLDHKLLAVAEEALVQ